MSVAIVQTMRWSLNLLVFFLSHGLFSDVYSVLVRSRFLTRVSCRCATFRSVKTALFFLKTVSFCSTLLCEPNPEQRTNFFNEVSASHWKLPQILTSFIIQKSVVISFRTFAFGRHGRGTGCHGRSSSQETLVLGVARSCLPEEVLLLEAGTRRADDWLHQRLVRSTEYREANADSRSVQLPPL